jgi:hypothetical protein
VVRTSSTASRLNSAVNWRRFLPRLSSIRSWQTRQGPSRRTPWCEPWQEHTELHATALHLAGQQGKDLPSKSTTSWDTYDSHLARAWHSTGRHLGRLRGVTLAQRDPLATSLRIFDDGMAGSRQGGAYRRGAASQHRTAHPTGHSGRAARDWKSPKRVRGPRAPDP